MSLNIEKIREDFPILQREVYGKPLVYLDNAAGTQKPNAVLDSMDTFYKENHANVHRGLYKMSEESTIMYESAHDTLAKFIDAKGREEIVFTSGTTFGLNLVAYSLMNDLKEGDEVVLTEMEHHSNIVPWQQLAKRNGVVLKFIDVDPKTHALKEGDAAEKITNRTKIVSMVHSSNSIGAINPVEEIAKIAHENDAYFILDGAQSVPHLPVSVKKLNCDFLAFSGNKMVGPNGTGVLYGKQEILEKMTPFLYGGDMIREVTLEDARWNDLPWKFEAGTPNIAGGIGLGAAAEYISKIGLDKIHEHENELLTYALDQLQSNTSIELYGPTADQRGGVISFNVKNVHAHDVSAILNDSGVAVRAGHHCTQPLFNVLGVPGSARASFYFYNTKAEVDVFVEALKKVEEVFK